VSTPIHEPTIAEEGVLRPTHLEVDLGRLRHNYRAVAAHVGHAKVMPILKANAYGHGLVECARLFADEGAPYLGLAYLEEGMRLRQAGVTTPILVLGGILGRQIPLYLQHDLTLTASSVDKLQAIEAVAADLGRVAKVHLKIDTGMERLGVHWYSASKLLEASLRCPHVEVEGIFSHFARADDADLAHARLQLERFEEVLSFYTDRGLPTPIRHMANSGAILQLPESHYDLVRPGICLYGVYPSVGCARTVAVKPALSWKSRVVYFKVVRSESPVSYGGTWSSDHPVRLVTVPVGYGDGYQRRMSDRAEVIIRGERFPVVGRICMDQIMVNIEWGTAYNGDEVVLLGESGDVSIRAEELARWADTIPYEVLCGINTRVPRIYVERS